MNIEEIEKHYKENGFYRIQDAYWLIQRVKELESDLALNASMLAKQCDLARESETERERLSKELIEARMRVVVIEAELSEYQSKEIGCKKIIEVFKKINPKLERRINELEEGILNFTRDWHNPDIELKDSFARLKELIVEKK
jgi:chromosome segregation ATPase